MSNKPIAFVGSMTHQQFDNVVSLLEQTTVRVTAAETLRGHRSQGLVVRDGAMMWGYTLGSKSTYRELCTVVGFMDALSKEYLPHPCTKSGLPTIEGTITNIINQSSNTLVFTTTGVYIIKQGATDTVKLLTNIEGDNNE